MLVTFIYGTSKAFNWAELFSFDISADFEIFEKFIF